MFKRTLTSKEIDVIKKTAEFVKKKHESHTGHDYAHIVEVCRWAIEIGIRIKDEVDPFVVLCGSLLHDIGRIGAFDGSFHGIDGGTRAREFLNSLLDDQEMVSIISALVVRHTPTSMIEPKTLEEKIICDADGIDRLGLMGLVRGITNRKGSMEFIIKDRIKKRLQDYDKLYFNESKKLADPYYSETLRLVAVIENALDKRLLDIEQIESFKMIKEEVAPPQ